MANEFEDLIKEFGSKGKEVNIIPSTKFDDLITQFGSGKHTIVPAKQSQELGPPRPEETANYKPAEDTGSRSIRELKQGIQNLPSNWWNSLKENAAGGLKQAGQGLTDIAQNRPATGLGNVGMGILSAVTSPVTATSKELIKKPVTELTGSERIGDTAEFISTLGLPVVRGAKAINAMRPTNAAVEKIIDSIGEKNIPEVLNRLKSNDRLTVMDVSPAARQDAQKLVTIEGKHQTPMTEYISNREKQARGVVEQAYNDAMGAPVDVVKKIDALKQRARDTGAKEINPLVEASGPADITKVIKNIDAMIGNGPVERKTLAALKAGDQPSLPASKEQLRLWSIREKLRGIWSDKDQMFLDVKGKQGLHETQMGLRAEAQSMLNSSDPLQRKLGNQLMDVRNQLVEAGGSDYKKVLGKYADDISVQNAFDKGLNILKNRTGNATHIQEDHPTALRKWITTAKQDEIEALKEGARAAVDNQIRTARNAALKGEQIPDVEFNKEKLEILFGKKEVENLAKKLKDERDIAITTNDLIRGSQTAMRMRSNSRVDLPEKKGIGLSPFLAPAAELAVGGMSGVPGASIAVLGAQGAGKLAFKGKEALAKKTNEEYAKLLTAEGPSRQELIKILEDHLPKPKPSMLNRVSTAIGKVVGP